MLWLRLEWAVETAFQFHGASDRKYQQLWAEDQAMQVQISRRKRLYWYFKYHLYHHDIFVIWSLWREYPLKSTYHNLSIFLVVYQWSYLSGNKPLNVTECALHVTTLYNMYVWAQYIHMYTLYVYTEYSTYMCFTYYMYYMVIDDET
jgi:hypothetical protein